MFPHPTQEILQFAPSLVRLVTIAQAGDLAWLQDRASRGPGLRWQIVCLDEDLASSDGVSLRMAICSG
jgi:hypothetical protein